MTVAPRWEHRTETSVLALIGRGGGVATLFDDGTLSLLGEGGARAGELRLPHGKRVERGDAERPHCARVQCVGEAWLASIPGEPYVVRHAAGKTTRIAVGGERVDGFTVSGEQLAIARPGSVELWTLADAQRWQLDGGPFVAVTMAGRTVVALRADGELVFLSNLKGAVTGSLKLGAAEPAIAWHLHCIDGTRVALGFGEWLVVVDAATQKIVRRTRVRGDVISFAGNARRLVAGLKDGWVQLFDAFTGEARGALKAHDAPVVGVAIDGKVVFTAARTGPVRAWDEAMIEAAAHAGAPITALAARGSFVAVGDQSGKLRLTKGVEEVAALRLDGPIAATHVGPDDRVVAAASSVLVCLAKPWKAPTPVLLESPASALAVDGAYAFCGTEQGAVDVYELARGTHVTSYALSEAGITALARLPGAHLVVGTGALDGRLFVVDVAEAKVLHRIEAHQEAFGVTCLAAEARGRLVASGSDDGSIALIEPTKGRVLAHVRVTEAPASLAFDATGRKLAAVLANGAFLIVALDRKAEITRIDVPPAARVTWSDGWTIGLKDGRIERLTPH